MRHVLCIAWLVSLFVPAAADAGVTRLDIVRRETVLNGRPFGAAGPYEKLIGTVHFARDPRVVRVGLAGTRDIVSFFK